MLTPHFRGIPRDRVFAMPTSAGRNAFAEAVNWRGGGQGALAPQAQLHDPM